MLIEIVREPSKDGATIGGLSIDGKWLCWTCEDVVREVPGQPVETWKVPGQTAIPAGEYEVRITMSDRFGRLLPLLVDVPGFSGIRIHPGNTAADTDGCILPGLTRAGQSVGLSRRAFEQVFGAIQDAIGNGQQVTLRIR